MKKLKILINDLKNKSKKIFVDIYDLDRNVIFKKKVDINSIYSENKNPIDWFLDLPIDNIQIHKFRKNGYMTNGNPNYRKLPIALDIDLNILRNNPNKIIQKNLSMPKINHPQNNNHFGLNGVGEQGLMYLLEQEKNQHIDYKNNAEATIKLLTEKLENKTKKLNNVKEILQVSEQDLKLVQFKEDIKTNFTPFLATPVGKQVIESGLSLLKNFTNPQTGLNGAVEQENLTTEQTQFIPIVKKMNKFQIDTLYSVYEGINNVEAGKTVYQGIVKILEENKIIEPQQITQ